MAEKYNSREIADLIARKWLKDSLEKIPSLKEMSQELKCSLRGIREGLDLLVEEGRMQKRSRGRPPKSGNQNAEINPVERVSRFVEGGMLGGRFRRGAAIPKVSWFSAECHASPNAVCGALRRLAERGLLHRRGKSWVAGPANTPVPFGRSGECPVVLLVVPSVEMWHQYCRRSTTSYFLDELLGEFDRNGLTTLLCGVNSQDKSYLLAARGQQELFGLRDTLGSRYRGVTLLGAPGHYENLSALLGILKHKGLPVVWYNHSSEGEKPIPATFGHNGLFRCAHDVGGAIEICIHHLSDLGHRSAVVFRDQRYRDSPWLEARIQALIACGEQLSEPLHIKVVDKGPSFHEPSNDLAGVEITGGGREDVRHVLAPFFAPNSPTAIIALNQGLGAAYYQLLCKAGKRIPRDISIIAFDNYRDHKPYPISTIDTGGVELGYMAAHLFIGDLALRLPRNGELISHPRLIDRGSLGRLS